MMLICQPKLTVQVTHCFVLRSPIAGRIVDKHCLYDANLPTKINNTIIQLHLALFYKPIDFWLAFYMTMDDVIVAPFIVNSHFSIATFTEPSGRMH
jgi:hypothetical protein